MAMPVKQPDDSLAGKALYNFAATFGDPAAVKQEIGAYWNKEGKLTSPTEIYAALIEKRVQKGEVSPERAGILRALFSDSFAPEYSTGYLAKHREPLVEGLAKFYAEQHPEKTVLRIEGDISNLGGLNKAMLQSAETLRDTDQATYTALLKKNGIESFDADGASKLGRAMADRVLHTICQMTLERLEMKANITPVRKGGDEISFIAELKEGVSEQDIAKTINEVQKNVAQFVELSAGLKYIPHTKEPDNGRRAGVGIGLHYVNVRQTHGQAEEIAAGIADSKNRYQTILHAKREGTHEMTSPNMKKLSDLLDKFDPPQPFHTVVPSVNASNANKFPDNSRHINLENTLESAGGPPLTPMEKQIALGTHALNRKIDFVTSLPMFENMQDEQLPHAVKKFGAAGIKLVNVDFSNVAGGNELSEEAGNAMIRAYRDVLLRSMAKSGVTKDNAEGLAAHWHMIAVRPGGKFTLLVPGDTSKDTLAQLAINLKTNLDEISQKPLKLASDAENEILNKIPTSAKLQKRYGENGEKIINAHGDVQLPISEVVNPKSGTRGSNVVMTFSQTNIDVTQPLGDQLKPLENDANKRQDQVMAYTLSQLSFADKENAKRSVTQEVTIGK